MALVTAVVALTGCGGDEGGDGNNGADRTAPTVVSVTPVNGASGVSAALTITATFSEPVRSPPSGSGLTITGGSLVDYSPPSSSGSGPSTTGTWAVPATLDYSTPYTVTIQGMVDEAGNSMAAAYAWSFTTGAAPQGTVPAPDDLAVAIRGTTATLTWTPVANALATRVYMRLNDGADQYLGDSVNTRVVSNLTPGSTYDFWVVSIDNNNLPSPTYTVVTKVLPAQPAVPTTTIYGADLAVAWSANGTSTYNIYCAANQATLTDAMVATWTPNATAFLVSAASTSPQTIATGISYYTPTACAVTEVLSGVESTVSATARNYKTSHVTVSTGYTTVNVNGEAELAIGANLVGGTATGFKVFVDAGGTLDPRVATPQSVLIAAPWQGRAVFSELFAADGTVLNYRVYALPFYDDGAGNTSMPLPDGSYTNWSAVLSKFDLGGLGAWDGATAAGESPGIRFDGASTIYWLAQDGTEIGSWDLTADTFGHFVVTGVVTDFVIDTLATDFTIYTLDTSGRTVYKRVDDGVTTPTSTNLLTAALPGSSASDLTGIAYTSSPSTVWMSRSTTTANTSIFCTASTTSANAAVPVTNGYAGVRSFTVDGNYLYFAATSGVYRLATNSGSWSAGCDTAPITPVLTVAANHSVASLAIDGTDLYYIDSYTTTHLGAPRSDLKRVSLSGTLPADNAAAAVVHAALWSAKTLRVANGSAFFLNGGFLTELPLPGPAVPSYFPEPAVKSWWPLADGTYFVTTVSGGYRLPIAYPVLVAAPTATSLTVAASGTAGGVTVDTAGSALRGVGNFYSVADISSGAVDLGVAGVPTSGTTFWINETSGTYTYRVCVENMAGPGPCADTNSTVVP
ncbi:MAG: Ig-like domain-containing protein [Deltaproteobacteria bacterium]|nr:Ig-like domain-containing protein [Deltaproteobacteria bacterium]